MARYQISEITFVFYFLTGYISISLKIIFNRYLYLGGHFFLFETVIISATGLGIH